MNYSFVACFINYCIISRRLKSGIPVISPLIIGFILMGLRKKVDGVFSVRIPKRSRRTRHTYYAQSP